MSHHAPEGLDARRTPLAEAMHTQRTALLVIAATGLALLIHLVAWLIR